jgi:hypothetical protein
MSGQIHTPAALTTVLLTRRQGGPHSRSGFTGEEKIILPLTGLEP